MGRGPAQPRLVYHTYTWFEIMPKTMPPVMVAGRKLPPGAITGAGLAASAVLSIVLLLVVKALAS